MMAVHSSCHEHSESSLAHQMSLLSIKNKNKQQKMILKSSFAYLIMAGYIFDKRNVLVQFIQNDENIKKLFFYDYFCDS